MSLGTDHLWDDIARLKQEIAVLEEAKKQLASEVDSWRNGAALMRTRLADMVQCLHSEILDEPASRPVDFEDSMHKLSVIKRRGGELIRLQRRQLHQLRAHFKQASEQFEN